ncbi:unnamed protein product [Mytilus coruscus]|uniref:Uncharacterized protein n=1 Tax=Mytilus coruscus TaxID=42192 RepID=A0A6J8A5S4_MYTCO|nr:unnamed protein product [Mytilus coruscus]
MRSKEEDRDIISVSYFEDENVNKEDSSTKQEKEDLFMYLKDDHEGLLLEIRLSELSCRRRILKVESPNGVKLGYVKKGLFSGYEICDANHISLFRFKLKSTNNEFKAEVTDSKTGKITAKLTQCEVEPDMQSFKIKSFHIRFLSHCAYERYLKEHTITINVERELTLQKRDKKLYT